MHGYVICSCCGSKIPATLDDVGRAVVCPTTRRLLMVRRGDVVLPEVPPPPAAKGPRGRGRWVAVGAVALLLLGIGGYFAWDRFGREPAQVAQNTDDDKPKPKVTEPPKKEEPKPPPKKAEPAKPEKTPDRVAVLPEPPSPITPPVTLPPPPPSIPRKDVDPVPPPTTPRPEPVPPPVEPPPPPVEPPPARLDAEGLTLFKLLKRIDLRGADEIRKELADVREVSLDTPADPDVSRKLFGLGLQLQQSGGTYPGPMQVAKKRPDLAGLPFLIGADTTLTREAARTADDRRQKLAEAIQKAGGKNPAGLAAALVGKGDGLAFDKDWATPEAVRSVQNDIWGTRAGVEALRRIEGPAALEALVQWAVFAPGPEVRAAAVDALKARSRDEVMPQLLEAMRHPWPRAAEHAAEALVALGYKPAVPFLASMLALTDPTDPIEADATDTNDKSDKNEQKEKKKFRRELVKAHNGRNCFLCHAPSPSPTDPLRAGGPELFVTGASIFLKGDFTLTVPTEGIYQYMVAVTEVPPDTRSANDPHSPHKEAIMWALRNLTDKDLGTDPEKWLALREKDRDFEDQWLRLGPSRYLSLLNNPQALELFNTPDFTESFTTLSDEQRQVVYADYVRRYGYDYTRNAYITYLQGLARNPRYRTWALGQLRTIYGPGYRFDRYNVGAAYGMLGSSNAAIRRSAIGMFDGTGGNGVVSGVVGKPYYGDVIKLFQDEDDEVRLRAVRAMAALKEDDWTDDVFLALAGATADKSPAIRTLAAQALAKLQAFKGLTPQGARALADGLVRRSKWDTPDQRAEFEKQLRDLYRRMGARPEMAQAYGPVLQGALGEVQTDLSPAVLAQLLGWVKTPAKADLPKLPLLLGRPEFKATVAPQLYAGGDDAVLALIATLADKTKPEQVRAGAAEVLGRTAALNGGTATNAIRPKANDALAVAETDASEVVRKAAAAARKQLYSGQGK